MQTVHILHLALILSCLLGCKKPAAGLAGSQAAAPTSVDELLDRVEKTLQELPAYSCQLDVSLRMKAEGMENRMDSAYDVRIEKPRRWAIVMKTGMMGGSSVSNGKEMTNYLPMLSRYAVEPLPDDWEKSEPSADDVGSMTMMGPAGYVHAFMGRDFKKLLMEGVTDSKFVGPEKIDGQACWRCDFTQESLKWQLWITQGPQQLPRRVKARPDFSAAAGQMGDALKNMSMEVQIDFSDWEFKPTFADDDFAFDPPAGAEKVDSLMGGIGGPEQPHPLVGEPAPDFELQRLDGDEFKLSDVLGKEVVVLDFWATWCTPCVKALPEIAAAAHEMGDKGVVFFAVNLREEADEVREFLAKKGLDAPVLLDSGGAVGDQYQATAIPQTVLIGKDGRVQVVHVGFSGDVKGKLIEEITALVDGKDLATESLNKFKEETEAAAEKAEVSLEPRGLNQLWSKRESYSGVAVDGDNIYALRRGGKLHHFDPSGKQLEEVLLEGEGGLLRLANLAGDALPEFLIFNVWGDDLLAFDRSGKKLWSYPRGSGINDVYAADLDGDGIDEVAIGFNGGDGLHVVNHDGKLRWKTTAIGNVWHVSAGRFPSADAMYVVSTSAQGRVHIFDAKGKPSNEYEVSLYGHGIRVAATADGKAATAVVTGSTDDGEVMALIDGAGEEMWTRPLPSLEDHVRSLTIDSAGQYAVVGMDGGLVYAVELATGAIVGSVGRQGQTPEMAILRGDGRPLVVVCTGHKLTAFELAPEETASELDDPGDSAANDKEPEGAATDDTSERQKPAGIASASEDQAASDAAASVDQADADEEPDDKNKD